MRPSREKDSGKSQHLGIEILRFFSAVVILVYHYRNFGPPLSESGNLDPFYRELAYVYRSGFFAVQIFWCISGYIFFMNYGTAILKGSVNFRDFAIRRFSRLYPLHLATLLLVGLLQHLYRSTTGSYWIYDLNDGYHFIQQMLFASNWFRGGGFSYNGPVWSVSVELVAYVAFFFLALSGKLSILWSALVMVAAGLGRIISPDYEALFTCILFFFAGGIAYRLGYLLRHEPQSLPMWVVPVAVFLVTAEILLLVSAPHPLQLIDPDFVLVVLVPGLIFLAGDRIKLPVLFERIVRVLGNMTYSSYLLQFPIQLFVALICAKIGIRIPYASNLLFILFILCTLLLAYLSYQYFERPAQQWIRFFGLKR